jgi:hypothetical protein
MYSKNTIAGQDSIPTVPCFGLNIDDRKSQTAVIRPRCQRIRCRRSTGSDVGTSVHTTAEGE